MHLLGCGGGVDSHFAGAEDPQAFGVVGSDDEVGGVYGPEEVSGGISAAVP
jgi:hypothetical protein